MTISSRENTTHGTIHFSKGSGNHQYVGDYNLGSGTLADAFTPTVSSGIALQMVPDGAVCFQQITTSDRTEFHEEFFVLFKSRWR